MQKKVVSLTKLFEKKLNDITKGMGTKETGENHKAEREAEAKHQGRVQTRKHEAQSPGSCQGRERVLETLVQDRRERLAKICR